MSSGAGPIIIHDLIANPGITIMEKLELQQMLKRYKEKGSLEIKDRVYVTRLAWKLSK